MVNIAALWLPIVLSAVAVFIVSSIIHIVLTYHRNDFAKLPNEDQLRAAIRSAGVAPGDYMFPHAANPKDMGTPEMQAKFTEGPVGVLTALPNAPPAMPKQLVMWFVYCLAIGLFVAYVAGRTTQAGAGYMAVFRIAGTVAFLGYAAAQVQESIWTGRKWSSTVKNVFDGLVYGLVTAGVFGWLWPAGH